MHVFWPLQLVFGLNLTVFIALFEALKLSAESITQLQVGRAAVKGKIKLAAADGLRVEANLRFQA